MAEPLRALIVDDSKPVRSILAKMLVDLGYECDQAGDGEEGLAILARGIRPDVVTVNLHMPVMDGLEATAHLRAGPRGDEALVVGLTAAVLPEDLAACARAGMVGVVAKPMTMASLGTGIRAALDARGR